MKQIAIKCKIFFAMFFYFLNRFSSCNSVSDFFLPAEIVNEVFPLQFFVLQYTVRFRNMQSLFSETPSVATTTPMSPTRRAFTLPATSSSTTKPTTRPSPTPLCPPVVPRRLPPYRTTAKSLNLSRTYLLSRSRHLAEEARKTKTRTFQPPQTLQRCRSLRRSHLDKQGNERVSRDHFLEI